MATGTLAEETPGDSPLPEQVKAWSYYGLPFTPGATSKSNKDALPTEAVGEVRYIVGWMSDQLSRLQWNVVIGGSTQWKVKLPNGETVDSSQDLRGASDKVLSLIGWGKDSVRQIGTNLFVAGKGDYVATKKPNKSKAKDKQDEYVWTVVSVVRRDRKAVLTKASHRVPILWPHPADPEMPDAPLFGVLSVLDDLLWLSKLSRWQSASRVGMRGFLGAADGLSMANGGDFWNELKKGFSEPMRDPTDLSPFVIRGAESLVEPVVGGMRGFSWVIPEFPYDERLDARINKNIQRLAYGLPIPPEILTGLQIQSRATAFQVEENSYRAHIEPPAQLVANVAVEALSLLLPDLEIAVEPDPTELLARRHSIEDVKYALEHGATSYKFFRQILDIPETEAATEDDLALLAAVKSGLRSPAGRDPANIAAQEPITASVGGPQGEGLTSEELSDLSQDLYELDQALLLELGGATQQAVDRARDRVGARARTYTQLRNAIDKEVPNSEVAVELTVKTLEEAGIPVETIVQNALEPLTSWWGHRIHDARQQLARILDIEVMQELDESFLKGSVDTLRDLTVAHVMNTLEAPASLPLPTDDRRQVMAVAGGESPE